LHICFILQTQDFFWTTISPQNAIIYSIFSIPQQVVHLVFELFDSFFLVKQIKLLSSLTTLTLQHNKSKYWMLEFYIQFSAFVDSLPPTLIHLTTGIYFNLPVDKLSPTLTHLTVGLHFNHLLDKLPPTLTHLTIRAYLNQQADTFFLCDWKKNEVNALCIGS
jgi:hypothetical protein